MSRSRPQRGEHNGALSRRAWLAGAAATMALVGCGRGRESSSGRAAPSRESGGEAAESRPTLPLPASEPVVRVRVLNHRGGALDLRMGEEGQWLGLGRPRTGEPEVITSGPVIVHVRDDGWSITDGRGFRPVIEPHEPFEVRGLMHSTPTMMLRAADTRGRSLFRAEAPSYPGALRVVPRGDPGSTALAVVNHLPMEQYLPGVLAGELYGHWKSEAFAAQAIAARSFAAHEHAYFVDRRHFDVTDTASSQMYVGETTLARATEAVHATRGLVLEHDYRLVPGYYSSCCGGTAACATDVMGDGPGNHLPPLKGRSGDDVCQDAPRYRWRIIRSRDDTVSRLRAYGAAVRDRGLASLDSLRSITAAAHNPQGRPTEYALHRDGAEPVRVGAERLRFAFNHDDGTIPAPDEPLHSSFIEAVIDGDTITIDGRGHGHGVGLCQYGAQRLARDGMTHEAIIRWYYPGASITGAYV